MHNNYKTLDPSPLNDFRIEKCTWCDEELRLEQKTVRYQNKWFHVNCFKQTLEPPHKQQANVIRLHENYTKKEAIIHYDKPTAKIITIPVSKKTPTHSCFSCNLILNPEEKTIQHENNWFHSDCFKSINVKPPVSENLDADKAANSNPIKITNNEKKIRQSPKIFPVLAMLIVGMLVFFIYGHRDVLYARFGIGFLKWVLGLGFWDVVAIVSFTVIIDIFRNIVKCVVLISDAILQKIRPQKLDETTNPKITILVPAHNESYAIQNTIMSLLENPYQNKEIIVIDDHSTDDTYERALPFHKSGKIKLVRRTGGIGSKSMAINYGILFATGDVIMITDGDTLIERNALSEIAKRITLPKNVAISGNVRILAGDGGVKNLLTRCQSYEYLIAFELGRRYNALANMLIIIPGAFSVLLKNTAKQIGLYDRDTLTEDFDLTLKLLKTGGKIDFVSNAVAWTYCPNNWKSWIRQRIRWSHGQFSTLLKHKDIEMSHHFRRPFVLAIYDMIFMDIVLLLVRMAGVVWLAFTYTDSIIYVYTMVYALYFVNEAIVISTSALLSPYKRDLKYVYLVPFVVTIYRPISTYVRFYGYIKSLLKKDTKW